MRIASTLTTLFVLSSLSLQALAQCPTQKLTSGGGAESFADYFGRDVAVDSGTMAVAAADDISGHAPGAVHVFREDGLGSWLLDAILPNPAPPTESGYYDKVDLSGPDLLIVGDTSGDGLVGSSGVAHVYRHDGVGWNLEQTLAASDGMPLDAFGRDLAIDGDVAAVGAAFADFSGQFSGAVYLFRYDGTTWNEEAKFIGSSNSLLGTCVELDGNRAIVGLSGVDRARIFAYDGSTWAEEVTLIPSGPHDFAGTGVDIDGDVVVVGAMSAGTVDQGKAFIFRHDGVDWVQEQTLVASGPASPGAWFGTSCAIEDDIVVIGAWYDSSVLTQGGAAYVFVHDGTSWVEQKRLEASPVDDFAQFGCEVGLSGDTIVIGAHEEDVGGWAKAGAAYVYDFEPSVQFTSTPATVSAAAGASIAHQLLGGECLAGLLYVVLGTTAGTSPGIPFGDVVLPLNPSGYFSFSLNNLNLPPFTGTFGILDSMGAGSASMTIHPGLLGPLVGTTVNHAALLFTLSPFVITQASTATGFVITP